MDTLVSVVTLTYKRFDKLYDAIDSVLEQDYSEIEYIIADDGSPLFPEDEIKNYIEKHRGPNLVNVKVFTHDKNQGTVRNINDAYQKAEGEIIIPLAGDDALLDSTVISRIVSVFEERKCDALVIGRALYNEKGKFVRNIPSKKEAAIMNGLKNNKEQYQRFITTRFYEAYSGCVLSVRRSFIREWGFFDEKYVLWEDGPFFAQYLWNNYMECAFEIIGIRYNEGGVSNVSKGQHPLLKRDEVLFQSTDLVEHINDITWLQRAMVNHSLMRAKDGGLSLKSRLKAAIRYPFGFIGNNLYKISLKFLRD